MAGSNVDMFAACAKEIDKFGITDNLDLGQIPNHTFTTTEKEMLDDFKTAIFLLILLRVRSDAKRKARRWPRKSKFAKCKIKIKFPLESSAKSTDELLNLVTSQFKDDFKDEFGEILKGFLDSKKTQSPMSPALIPGTVTNSNLDSSNDGNDFNIAPLINYINDELFLPCN